MKLPLPLTEQDRKTLTNYIARGKELFKKDKDQATRIAQIKENQEKLQREVREMEANFNAADMRMLQSLTSKKGQLAVLSEQLDHFGLDARSRKQELSDYYNLMLAMGETLAPFCNISAAKMKDELTAVLRPYYQTNGAARDAAGSATCLMIFYGWKTGLLAPGAPKKSVERMSDVFERILAGEDFWTFDPYQFEPKDKI